MAKKAERKREKEKKNPSIFKRYKYHRQIRTKKQTDNSKLKSKEEQSCVCGPQFEINFQLARLSNWNSDIDTETEIQSYSYSGWVRDTATVGDSNPDQLIMNGHSCRSWHFFEFILLNFMFIYCKCVSFTLTIYMVGSFDSIWFYISHLFASKWGGLTVQGIE